MVRLAIAYLLAFGIGVFCRYFQIPAPAPPAVPGALLVAAMTLGYVLGDKVLPAKGDGKNGTTISASAQSGAESKIKKYTEKLMRSDRPLEPAFAFAFKHF